ncbi:MAG: glycine zipper domain-containing protein [Candidatus Omnitrophica bacterium]|nr:glycine zipper domain-containing protein [Candidatus Omnitrophota bacterium]
MKKFTLVVLVLSLVALAGCESMGPKSEKGAVVGGLVGAAAGGIIGNQVGNPFIGAGIGAATGAVAGGLLGDAWDKQDQAAVAVNPNHLTLTKIAEMGDQGTPDAVIISEIQRTRSVYQLNSEIITYLKQHKISDKVIDYMMSTATPVKQ